MAQFRELPEGGEYQYELQHGEVVRLTRPSIRHWDLQRRLSRLLEMQLDHYGVASTEMAYRPLG